MPYNAFTARVESATTRMERDGTRLELLLARARAEGPSEDGP